MIRTRKRPSAARLIVQATALAAIGSSISAGCSSGVKTVTVECIAGASTFGGRAGNNAGEAGSVVASGGSNINGEAGQAGAGGSEEAAPESLQGGASGSAESAGSAGNGGAPGNSIGGRGGTTGSAGYAGSTGGHGTSNTGGHGGTGGSSGAAGNHAGGAAAKCGDKVTTPPEFCDDGTNTDLSYGCTACTTLTGTRTPAGAQQCDACLNGTLSSCFACQDYRPCYLCLRQQGTSTNFTNTGSSGLCYTYVDDDMGGQPLDPTASATSRKDYSDRCFDPKNFLGQTQVGGLAGSKTFSAECEAVVACVLRTGCNLAGGLFESCYCGLPTKGCGTDPNRMPFGACQSEIREAAGIPVGETYADEAVFISTIVSDPDHAIGVAYQISGCAAELGGCHDQCFPSDKSTGAGGGGQAGASAGAAAGNAGHGGS